MKKIYTILAICLIGAVAQAQVTIAPPVRGGTGTSQVPTNGQILIGNSGGTYTPTTPNYGTGSVTQVTASSPLTGGTFTTSGTIGCQTASGSQAGCLSSTNWTTFNNKTNWATTSSDYWLTQQSLSAFSTTSANYWKTVNNFFSTTSANYWLTQQTIPSFSTTSTNYFVNASSTIAAPAGLGSNSSTGGVIQWNGSKWVAVATSSLGIAGGTSSNASSTLLSDYNTFSKLVTVPDISITYGTSSTATSTDFSWHHISFWGDSLTAGVTQIPYPTQIGTLLNGVTIDNEGVSGNTMSQIYSRFIVATSTFQNFTVIWAGNNDCQGGTCDSSALISYIDSMISKLPASRHYLVMSIINNTSNYSGTAGYTAILAANAALSAHYGANYVDERTFINTSCNAVNTTGWYASTTQDVIDCGKDITPNSLRIDGVVHLNTSGYSIIAKLLVNAINSQISSPKKYIDYSNIPKLFGSPSAIGSITPAPSLNIIGSTTNAYDYALNVSTPTGTTTMFVANNGTIGIGSNRYLTGTQRVSIAGSPATGLTGTESILRLVRPYNSGVAFDNGVDFKVGNSVAGTNSFSQLDICLDNNATNGGPTIIGSCNSTVMTLIGTGNVGIGTTTPGSLLSIGNTAGINFSTATSTFSSTGGINLKSGCFAINGSCISGGTGGSSQWTTSGSNIYYNGSVGIGTTSPFATLSVAGNGFFNGNLTAANITATGTLSVSGDILSTATNGACGGTCVIDSQVSNGGGPRISFGDAGSVSTFFELGVYGNQNNFDTKNRDLQLFSNSASGIMIKATTGNIGIGTTSPYAKLSVVGPVVAQNFIATTTIASSFPYASTTALSATTLCISTDCKTAWPTGTSQWTTTGSNIYYNGYVGIGTTSPAANLELNGNLLLSNTGTIQVRYGTSNATSTKISFDANGGMFLSGISTFTFNNGNSIIQNNPVNYAETIFTGASSDVAAMTWRENGNVGIGTTSPTYPLDVYGGTLGLTSVGANNASLRIKTGDNAADWSFTTNTGTGLFSFYNYLTNKTPMNIATTAPNNSLNLNTSSVSSVNPFSSSNGASSGTTYGLSSISNQYVNQNMIIGGSGTLGLQTYAGAWTTRLSIANNGNINIGTSTAHSVGMTLANGDLYVATSTGAVSGVVLQASDGSCHRLVISNLDVITSSGVTCP